MNALIGRFLYYECNVYNSFVIAYIPKSCANHLELPK